MRVSLIKNGKIYNTNLPHKVNGSFWIEDKDKNNLKRNLINIEAKDGKWQLKSNFETKEQYENEKQMLWYQINHEVEKQINETKALYKKHT